MTAFELMPVYFSFPKNQCIQQIIAKFSKTLHELAIPDKHCYHSSKAIVYDKLSCFTLVFQLCITYIWTFGYILLLSFSSMRGLSCFICVLKMACGRSWVEILTGSTLS